MGWWAAGNGIWGDEPADVLDKALDQIVAIYRRDWGRDPYEGELRAGLKFCMPERIEQPEAEYCTRTPEQAAAGPCGKPARQSTP